MPTFSRFTMTRVNGGWLIGIEGRGTFMQSPGFAALVAGCLEGDGEHAVIDLNACQYLDSSFLGCLVGLHRRFAMDGQERLQIVASEAARQRLLCPAGLERLFDFAPERPQPLDEPVEVELQSVDRRQLGRHMLAAHRDLAELGGPAAEQFRAVAQRLAAELAEEN